MEQIVSLLQAVVSAVKDNSSNILFSYDMNGQERVECPLGCTWPITAPQSKINDHVDKAKTKQEKKVEFVNLPIVANLNDRLWKKGLPKKLKTGSKKLKSKEYGVLDKKVRNCQIKGNNSCKTRSDLDELLRDI